MKKILRIFASVFFLAGIVSLAFAIHEEMPSETQVPMPGPDAVKLYNYIAKLRPYDSWQLWPGTARHQTGAKPHGAFVTAYVNKAGYFAARKETKMPDGAIVVLENYGSDKKLASLSVMYKILDYNPAAGNWFWAEYDPFGKTLASGKIPECIDCHGKSRQKDYILGMK